MAENISLTEDSVQETMLGPLWARTKVTEQYPGILKNKARNLAEEIILFLERDYKFERKVYYW